MIPISTTFTKTTYCNANFAISGKNLNFICIQNSDIKNFGIHITLLTNSDLKEIWNLTKAKIPAPPTPTCEHERVEKGKKVERKERKVRKKVAGSHQRDRNEAVHLERRRCDPFRRSGALRDEKWKDPVTKNSVPVAKNCNNEFRTSAKINNVLKMSNFMMKLLL